MVRLNLCVRLIVATCLVSFLPIAGVAAQSCPRIEFGVFHEKGAENTRRVKTAAGKTIFFERTPVFQLSDIAQVRLGGDKATVLVNVKANAAERLKSATTGHSGTKLAFVVDDQALMAVVWQGDYGLDDGGMQLSLRSKDAARGLVDTIARCIEPGLR